MSATFVSHAAALASAARDLSPNAPGVAEVLMLAAGPKGPWQAWAGDLVDRHPSGADGDSPLVSAWMAFDQATDRRGAARQAQRLLLPAQAAPVSDHHGVQVMHHVHAARSVLALVSRDLGGMWELAFVRMKPADFEAFTTGTHLDALDVRYLERTAVDDQGVGLELVAEWQASPVWQRALRAAERRTLSAYVPMPQGTAARVRARL